jgi:hypothetical protein
MSSFRPLPVVALAVLVAASAPSALAVNYDGKSVSPSVCQPYAPDTTAAEIQVSQTGIYNPGTVIEKVICPLPRDAEVGYSGDNTAVLAIHYRVLGAAPGRVTCTMFVGSSSQGNYAVATATASGDLVSAGARDYFYLTAPSQNENWLLAPNVLICAISPKTSLGAIAIEEESATQQNITG